MVDESSQVYHIVENITGESDNVREGVETLGRGRECWVIYLGKFIAQHIAMGVC